MARNRLGWAVFETDSDVDFVILRALRLLSYSEMVQVLTAIFAIDF